jgi:hypothetical protein
VVVVVVEATTVVVVLTDRATVVVDTDLDATMECESVPQAARTARAEIVTAGMTDRRITTIFSRPRVKLG